MANFSFPALESQLDGELFYNQTYQYLYATDASAYREEPLAVVYPKNAEDIRKVIDFAAKYGYALIPRGGGTSLAGQVVGNGIVVDISKHLNQVLEINAQEQYAWVEPGVIRDDLNVVLKSKGLFFAPETSTSNRATIGGMFGNNSCGGNTLIYGSTRQHILEAEGFLPDGSRVCFKPLSYHEILEKRQSENLEGQIYEGLYQYLKEESVQDEIKREFPNPKLIRRSTGYAVDEILDTALFRPDAPPLNLCTLLAGSEGTLFFAVKLKIKLSQLPPKHQAVIAVHTHSVLDTLHGNLIALKFHPTQIELIDHTIIRLSLENKSQAENHFFIQDSPQAIMAVEFSETDENILEEQCRNCIRALQENGIGYHFPVIKGADCSKVWNLRKAGLGILANLKGDEKAVSLVEDAAILPEDLPAYFTEFDAFMAEKGLKCVYYAHISTGEIHKKPILNLKEKQGLQLYREIAEKDAALVKKYRGSLSGEHGDGRLRGEFLPYMIGNANYQLLRQIKLLFDPQNRFNRGKITDTPPMDTALRTHPNLPVLDLKTYFDYPETDGFLRAVEKCCGSGDCRRSYIHGGAMCPSFQATGDEKLVTRARANLFRELLYAEEEKAFENRELYDLLSLCLACKACKSECPSQVDMTKLRAEFLQHYYQKRGISFRSWLIGYYPIFNELGAYFSGIYNFVIQNKITSNLFKRLVGFAPQRSLPRIYRQSLYSWHQKRKTALHSPIKTVYFFCDEFTNRNDVEIGKTALLLLERLGYNVQTVKHPFSGRTFLSKGMLKKAKFYAEKNVQIFGNIISENTPLIGLEPSAILSFRDEYPDLLRGESKILSQKLAQNTFLIDEFLCAEFQKGNISSEQFTGKVQHIIFHAHCYQKAISDKTCSKTIMEIPKNYTVTLLKDGCCGMAGAFGYEKEHYDLSQSIGELVLFPAVRNAAPETLITACGTSCRHQIKDGTGKVAWHPVEVLYRALV